MLDSQVIEPNNRGRARRIQAVVVGGGQAGLATGYRLAQAGVEFVILERGARIGDVWRNRWDSLRLFTAAEYTGLPGWPFPGDPNAYPGKDELADYLELYAERFRLPVRLNTAAGARAAWRSYRIIASYVCYEADHVVVATGSHATTTPPSWAAGIDRSIVQIRSSDYKNPRQLPEGDVLVVGAGNTGAELALEATAAGHRVRLAGRDVGQVPRFFAGRTAGRSGPGDAHLYGQDAHRTQDPRAHAGRT